VRQQPGLAPAVKARQHQGVRPLRAPQQNVIVIRASDQNDNDWGNGGDRARFTC
jgi:hypothetical protein